MHTRLQKTDNNLFRVAFELYQQLIDIFPFGETYRKLNYTAYLIDHKQNADPIIVNELLNVFTTSNYEFLTKAAKIDVTELNKPETAFKKKLAALEKLISLMQGEPTTPFSAASKSWLRTLPAADKWLPPTEHYTELDNTLPSSMQGHKHTYSYNSMGRAVIAMSPLSRFDNEGIQKLGKLHTQHLADFYHMLFEEQIAVVFEISSAETESIITSSGQLTFFNKLDLKEGQENYVIKISHDGTKIKYKIKIETCVDTDGATLQNASLLTLTKFTGTTNAEEHHILVYHISETKDGLYLNGQQIRIINRLINNITTGDAFTLKNNIHIPFVNTSLCAHCTTGMDSSSIIILLYKFLQNTQIVAAFKKSLAEGITALELEQLFKLMAHELSELRVVRYSIPQKEQLMAAIINLALFIAQQQCHQHVDRLRKNLSNYFKFRLWLINNRESLIKIKFTGSEAFKTSLQKLTEASEAVIDINAESLITIQAALTSLLNTIYNELAAKTEPYRLKLTLLKSIFTSLPGALLTELKFSQERIDRLEKHIQRIPNLQQWIIENKQQFDNLCSTIQKAIAIASQTKHHEKYDVIEKSDQEWLEKLLTALDSLTNLTNIKTVKYEECQTARQTTAIILNRIYEIYINLKGISPIDTGLTLLDKLCEANELYWYKVNDEPLLNFARKQVKAMLKLESEEIASAAPLSPRSQ